VAAAVPLSAGARPARRVLDRRSRAGGVLWLDDDVVITGERPEVRVRLQPGQVPEFLPAPQYAPATLADVRIFYSFDTGDPDERHSGLIAVRAESGQLRSTPAPRPPLFRTVYETPEATVPELGELRPLGARTAWCGDPERPVELRTTTWETASGGRLHIVHVDGVARKRLYDFNGNGVIELETWDADGDGRFDARRDARYATPAFLLPEPLRNAHLLEPDTVPPDSAWLALFNEPRGPFRFTRPPPAPAAPLAELGPLPPPDSAWLGRFLEVDAGPFRFTQPARAPADTALPRIADQPAAPPAAAPGAPGAPGAPDAPPVAAPDTPAATTPTPRPPQRRTTPLGTPVRPPGGGTP
jgi:hypothetical protein